MSAKCHADYELAEIQKELTAAKSTRRHVSGMVGDIQLDTDQISELNSTNVGTNDVDPSVNGFGEKLLSEGSGELRLNEAPRAQDMSDRVFAEDAKNDDTPVAEPQSQSRSVAQANDVDHEPTEKKKKRRRRNWSGKGAPASQNNMEAGGASGEII